MDSYFKKYKFLTEESEIEPDLICAALLDPKFKRFGIVETSAKRSEYYDVAKQRINRIVFPEENINIIDDPEKSFEFHLSNDGIEKNNCRQFSTTLNEIIDYLKISNRPQETVESFYKSNPEYKRLSSCLERFLIAPATSVPSERLFSHTEDQVN